MSKAKTSRHQTGIETRRDAKGKPSYRGTAYDRRAQRQLRGPWTYNKAEAKSWRIDAQAKIQTGTLSAAAGPTVAEAAEQFITGIKSGAVRERGGYPYKPSTIRGYERHLNGHTVTAFGTRRLNQLQRPDLQRWVDDLSAGDRAPSTVKNIVAALRALVGFGELRGWVHSNPCTGLRLPSGEKIRDRTATRPEVAALIAAMRPKIRSR